MVAAAAARKKHKHAGAPTTYRRRYCDEIINYFNIPATTTSIKTIVTSKGTEITEEIERAATLPTMERFAGMIGTTHKTLLDWKATHPEFCEAYVRAQGFQKAILNENGTKGLYQAQYTIFVAKNCTDMKDKSEVAHELGAETLDAILAGLPDELRDTVSVELKRIAVARRSR